MPPRSCRQDPALICDIQQDAGNLHAAVCHAVAANMDLHALRCVLETAKQNCTAKIALIEEKIKADLAEEETL